MEKKNPFENFKEIVIEKAGFSKSAKKLQNKNIFLFQIPINVIHFYHTIFFSSL